MSATDIKPKKIILAPSGSDGDIFPMVTFGKRLRARGHSVTAYSLPSAKKHFAAAEIPFVEAGLDVQAFIQGKNLASLSPRARLAEMAFMRKDVERQFAVLREGVQSADVLFSGGYNYAAASVAESRGLPHVHVFHVPNVYPTDEHPCMNVRWQKMPAWANQTSWLVNGQIQNTLFRGVVNRERKAMGLAAIGSVWENFTANSMLAIPPALHRVPAREQGLWPQTSYWFSDEEPELPDDLLEFLDRGARPFYFGLGSMPSSDRAGTLATLSEICRKFGTRAIVSSGWAGFEAVSDPAIFVVGKVSHARLFQRVEFVVHHGGPGTVSTAARAGAAQILIPHIFDQFYWGRRVAELGLGPEAISHSSFSPETLAGRVSQIRTGAYTSRVRAMCECLQGSDGITEFLRPEFQSRWRLAL